MIIGKIVAIDYNKFKVQISAEITGNVINSLGKIYYFGNIGSYLKVNNSIGETLICEVVSIFDEDKLDKNPSFNSNNIRSLILKPIGTKTNKSFSLGVGIFPTLYNDVSIVTHEDLEAILKSIEEIELESKGDYADGKHFVHNDIYLGESKNLIQYKMNVNITKLFNIHMAVLGNTGSGKSNTIAHIFQEIYKKTSYSAKGSCVILFDVNGEYKNAFPKTNYSEINIRYLKPNLYQDDKNQDDKFYLPYFLFSLDEWCSFLMASDATQRPFWSKVLDECYRFYSAITESKGHNNIIKIYLFHKIYDFVSNVLKRGLNDTEMINIINNLAIDFLDILKEIKSNLCESDYNVIKGAIEELKTNCTIEYGKNKNKVYEFLEKIQKNFDSEEQKEVENIMNKQFNKNIFYSHKYLIFATKLCLNKEKSIGNNRIGEYTSTLITRLNVFLNDPECQFMREENCEIKVEEKYIEWLLGSEKKRNNLIIIDTSELSRDSLEILTSILCRILFDFRKKQVGSKRRENPIHLILDEAHRYIKKDSSYQFKENIFEKIAREGRKYSLYLLISSQRPSELSPVVLSQCSNFIIHRILNERDINYINAILPYLSDDITSKIKLSAPGEAVVFGNCVPMPMHIKIQKANPEPNSQNCIIHEQWFKN